MNAVELLPVEGIPEIHIGDDLGEILSRAVGGMLRSRDVLVVTHKIVSKAEGRLVDLREVEPSPFAKTFAAEYDKDARQIEVVLRESRRIVKMDRGVIISETHAGLVCANAGVDASNVPGDDSVCLLPVDSDASATKLQAALTKTTGLDLAMIISDSFGRPWRNGITDVAIGVAGMDPFSDYRGGTDPHGKQLEASILAIADELAGAAELVMGKTAGIPAAIVRNYPYKAGYGTARDLVMDPGKDLFR